MCSECIEILCKLDDLFIELEETIRKQFGGPNDVDYLLRKINKLMPEEIKATRPSKREKEFDGKF